MTLRILAAAALLSLTTPSFAQYQTQADYRSEFGLTGGFSPILRPEGAVYQGSRVSNTPYFASATYHYNFTENFQAGISLGMTTQWATNGDATLQDLNGAPFQNQRTTMLFADRTWEATARFNYVLPFYDSYKFNYANLYFGVAGGAMFTVNDGSIDYKQVDEKQGPQYTFVNQYNYKQATGWVAGIQVGYAYYFAPRWGVQVEIAPRFARLYSLNPSMYDANANFQTFYMPTSLGLKFRLY